MALTRITSGVIGSNAVSAEKLANGSLTARTLANTSIQLRHLESTANWVGSVDTVTANVGTVQSNVNTVQANVNAQRSNVNTVSSNVGGVAANTIQNKANVDTALANVIQLNANIDVVSSNTDAVEARRVANLAAVTFTGQVNMDDDLVIAGNLIVNGDTTTANSVNMVVQDRMLMLANSATGSPAADVGILFNRGNQGNAAFFYDESGQTFKVSDTKDPSTNVTLSPVTAGNLDVGILTAATVKFDGADLSTAITDNRSGAISTVYASDLTASRALSSDSSGKIAVATTTLVELNYVNGVTSAIQTQIDAKDSQANAHDTFTKLNANINVVNQNVDSGVGQIRKINTATSTGSSNVFFVAVPSATQHPTDLDKILVSVDGLIQKKDNPGTSNNDYVYDSADASVTITDPSLPSGLTIVIDALCPRP